MLLCIINYHYVPLCIIPYVQIFHIANVYFDIRSAKFSCPSIFYQKMMHLLIKKRPFYHCLPCSTPSTNNFVAACTRLVP